MTPQPRCLRCHGNVYWDALERQWSCLQCGWRHYPPPQAYAPPGRTDRAGRLRPK